MVGLDNPIHIAFLLLIVLLVFGAKRLPEMGRSLGAGLRGFKESVSGETHSEQPNHLAATTTPDLVPESASSAPEQSHAIAEQSHAVAEQSHAVAEQAKAQRAA